LFGGNAWKKGATRRDGLRPGSPEAVEADRKKDRERKRAKIAEARAAQPAPVLPARPLGAPAPATVVAGLPGAPTPPGGDLAALPGIEGLPSLAWLTKDVAPLASELLNVGEELAMRPVAAKAKKARLPRELVAEILTEAKWPDKAKKMISDGAAEIAAMQLNKAEVPVAARPYMQLGMGAAMIAAGHMKILKRLDELIAVANVGTPSPDENKKPGA
jgi:hypothetical protein